MRDPLRKLYNYVSRILGIRFLYELFIQPIYTNEDIHRKEFVLNTILTGILSVLLFLGLSITWSYLFPIGEYSGISPWIFAGIFTFFAGLLTASRKGYWYVSSLGLIITLFIVTMYAVYQWSFVLPMIILGSVLTIVISSILFSNRFGFLVAVIITISVVILTRLQTIGIIPVNLYWQSDALSIQSVIEMGIIFLSISGISWLSNRETEHSLKRAHLSEQALKNERDLLEIRIEERTRSLKEIQEQQVTELHHLAQFGNLSSGIFHDLMTPLTSIIALVDELPESNHQTTAIKTRIEKAIHASKRIGEQLSIIRKEIRPEQVHEFVPYEQIRDAVDILGHKARILDVHCTISDCVQRAYAGNAVMFYRIVMNLLSNAIDSHIGERAHDTRMVTIACTELNGSLRLTITDTGNGIPPEIQSKIFDPFFTTKEKKGLGIGLGHTKHIIEHHFKGTISFTTSSRGTAFTVMLPIHKTAH